MPAIVELAPRPARADRYAPSAALVADAGALAPAIARVWPRPHAPYFAAEPARRRLACLIAARLTAPVGGREMAAFAEALETWSLKRLAQAYLPNAPAGFVEALRKLDGDFSAAELRGLVDLLAEPEGAKVLRHAARIHRGLILTLAALPPAFRRTRIVAQLTGPHLAELVARGAKRAVGREEHLLERLADRLERARSAQGLFRMLIEEIGLEQLAPPPVPGTDWFVPLATVTQIERAALRFENCLKGRIPLLLRGRAAYYEVVGKEPAVVEIVRDHTGLWVVGEVRGHANADISSELWVRIRDHLEFHGARVRGSKADHLALALANAAGW
ncbi:hypothetical protein U91I_03921 [alpha proteobacterium U9-1i]|nr:hypothetical protein U91I_03921 [alpha proteobacterium U9-1i]